MDDYSSTKLIYWMSKEVGITCFPYKSLKEVYPAMGLRQSIYIYLDARMHYNSGRKSKI